MLVKLRICVALGVYDFTRQIRNLSHRINKAIRENKVYTPRLKRLEHSVNKRVKGAVTVSAKALSKAREAETIAKSAKKEVADVKKEVRGLEDQMQDVVEYSRPQLDRYCKETFMKLYGFHEYHQ